MYQYRRPPPSVLQGRGVRADGAVGLNEVREHGMRQHGQVTEEIVEQIRFCQVVELFAATHPHGNREAALRQVREKVCLGDQTGHADDFKSGEPLQAFAGFFEHGDAVRICT